MRAGVTAGGSRGRAVVAASAAAGLMALARPGAAQVELTSRAAEIELGGRFQLQALGSSCSGFPLEEDSACSEQVPGLDMLIRRARLTVEVRFNDFIEGKIEPDFSDVDEVELKDAWGRLTFNPAAVLTIGHFKRPFDGFQLTSSTQFLTIERDLDVPGVPGTAALSYDELTTRARLSDRDVGIMLEGESADGRFAWWVGAFNGRDPADNEDLDTEKQLVGRGRVALSLGPHPLELAASLALTDVPFTRASGELAGEYFVAGELWAELGDFDGGPHLQAGLLLGENPLRAESGGTPDLAAGDELADMRAWQVIGAYRIGVPEGTPFVEAVEPLFRVSRADPHTGLDDDAVWGFTPGFQLFFAGRNKVAVNWDVVVFDDDALRTEHSLKAMYFFHF